MSNDLIYIDLLENQWKFIINICMESLPYKRFSRGICKCCLKLCQIRNRKCFLLSEKYFQQHYQEIKQIYYHHKIKYYYTIVDKVLYLQSLYEEYQQQDIFKYAINPILELLQYYDNKQHLLLKTIEAYWSYRESPLKLNNNQVKIILNVNQHIINDENIVYQRIIKKIIYNVQKQNISNMKHLRIGNKQFADSIKIIMERLREFKDRIQYQIKFKQFSNKVIEQLSISQNDKYLAVTTNRNELNIVDISQNQIIKQKKLCGTINMIQFDQTSNFLIVSCSQELSFYQFKRGFKNIKKLSTFILNNFIQISLKEIIIFNSYQFKIIDFNNSTLLQIDTRKPFEYTLALDYDKTNKTIVTSGLDGKIRIFDGITGKLLITKQVQGNNVVIMQLQLINNQQLLSKDFYELILWQISNQYQLLTIQRINHFQIGHLLSNFIFDKDEQIIYMIKNQLISKLDMNFMILETIDLTNEISQLSYSDYHRVGQSSSKMFLLGLSKESIVLIRRKQLNYE